MLLATCMLVSPPPTLSSEDLEVEVGTDDLPDAYRGCPVHPNDYNVSIVAIWNPQSHRLVCFQLWALVYGIASAVVAFNRLPTMLTAVHRRILFVFASAYFDDLPVVDCAFGKRPSTGPSQKVFVAHWSTARTIERHIAWSVQSCPWFTRTDIRCKQEE